MSSRHAVWMTTDTGYAPNAPGWTYHVVAWNELPRDVALGAIERVVLSDPSMDASMPTVLRELPNARSLATDAHLLAFTPADMPELAELQIGGTSEITLPTGPWRGLTSVKARDAVVSVADASDFPVLERLIVRTKGTKKAFVELAKIASLRELQIGPVKDAASLAPFEALPLRALSFNRGSLASLAPVARFGGLTTFGAMNCHAFKDLAPLTKISSLTEVWFNTCAGIEKAEALVDLPKLVRVKFWGCRDNGGALKKACKKLMAKGVAVETELFA